MQLRAPETTEGPRVTSTTSLMTWPDASDCECAEVRSDEHRELLDVVESPPDEHEVPGVKSAKSSALRSRSFAISVQSPEWRARRLTKRPYKISGRKPAAKALREAAPERELRR